MQIDLTQEEFDTLLLILRMATAAALRQGDRKLAYHFRALSNKINKDNPVYVPYSIPEEFKQCQ